MLNMESYERTLTILGSEWEVKIDPNMPEGTYGVCDWTSREIRLTDFNKIIDPEDYFSFSKPIEAINRTLRHEIVHAFLYELGREEYAADELLVDMLAFKLPHLFGLLKGEDLL